MASPSRWPTRSRNGRMLVFRSLLMAAFATATILSVGAAPAHATPSPGSLENQIDSQWNDLEPVIEHYNAIHQQYLEQKAKAAKLQSKIDPLEVQVQVALARVNGYSTSVFENGPGGTMATLLNSGASENAMDMLGLLEQMASQQRQDVSGTLKLQQKYQDQKKPIDVLVASLNDQQASLNSQKKTIQAKIDSLNKMRMQAYGRAAAPVACARSRAPTPTPATPAAAPPSSRALRSERSTCGRPQAPTRTTARV